MSMESSCGHAISLTCAADVGGLMKARQLMLVDLGGDALAGTAVPNGSNR